MVFDLPLGRRVVIGRGEDVDLRLHDADVSHHHCALEHRLAGVYVEDLQSTGGTLLDGDQVNAPGQLAADSADLRVGSSRLQIFRNMPDEPFPEIPGITIVRRLGAGGSGTVYEGLIVASKQVVAVKLLAIDADEVARQRFEREAALRDRLNHPGIAKILQLMRVDGRPCLVREMVPGRSLEAVVAEDGPMIWSEAFAIGVSVAQALAHAHSRGVVHRDVKPGNIIMDERGRQPRLIDFDLAKRLGPSRGSLTQLTQTGEGLGSLSYLAPEQLTGARDVNAQADIYGLGMTLYHMISGVQPFSDVDPEDYISALYESGPRAISQLVPGLPSSVLRVLERSYATKADQRHEDAKSFAMALSQTLSGQSGVRRTFEL